MGDDEALPDLRSGQVGNGNSSATGGSIHYHMDSMGKPSTLILVVSVGLALGLSVGAVVMQAWGGAMQREQARIRQEQLVQMVAAAEKRAMDLSYTAEREARIAQDKIVYFQTELAKRGINITTDGH